MKASILSILAVTVATSAGPRLLSAGRNSDTNIGRLGVEQPTIEILRDGPNVGIQFTGRLLGSVEAAGPWEEVVGATSPYSPAVPGKGFRFYRSFDDVVPSGGIFEGSSVVSMVVKGPLQTHFELAFAGLPDGIFPPRRDKPYFDGSVKAAGIEVPASLRVRGNSSLQECPFPKLKFKVAKDARKGTPFEGAREIKIGTHCADGGRGNIGRLRDERATFREALAYEAMQLLGFVSPRVRRARIEFRDTSPTNEFGSTQWVVTRNAMILDDVDVVAERLGGHALSDEELAALTNAGFEEQLITDLRFLHALFGNWDWKLSIDGVGLWNTDVVKLADGRYLPVAGDFDLSSWVTEQVLERAPRDFHPELAELDRQARFDIAEIRRLVKPVQFEAARDRFVQFRTQLEALVEHAEVDEQGRANARHHLAAFFEAIAAAPE